MPWGAVAGAVIGAGASIYSANKAEDAASQPQVSSSTSAPWAGLAPFLTGQAPAGQYIPGLYPKAAETFNRGAYAGPYIAPQSAYSSEAIDRLAGSARDPDSLVSRAQGQLGRTIGGDYLDVSSNPYLQGAVQQALDQTKRNVSGQFRGESFNSSANQEWLARHLADTALPIYADAYQKERQNQLNALSLAPGLQTANADILSRAGAAQEARGQQEIQAAQQQFYAPWDVLGRYGNVLGAVQTPFSTTTASSQPYYSNALAAGAGGALAGYQLGQNIQGSGLFGGGMTFPTGGGDPSGTYDPGYGYGGFGG